MPPRERAVEGSRRYRRYKSELERLLEAARKLAEENMALKKEADEQQPIAEKLYLSESIQILRSNFPKCVGVFNHPKQDRYSSSSPGPCVRSRIYSELGKEGVTRKLVSERRRHGPPADAISLTFSRCRDGCWVRKNLANASSLV